MKVQESEPGGSALSYWLARLPAQKNFPRSGNPLGRSIIEEQ